MLTSLHRTGKRFYFFSNLEPRYHLYRNEVGIKLEKQRTSESSDPFFEHLCRWERKKREEKKRKSVMESLRDYEFFDSSRFARGLRNDFNANPLRKKEERMFFSA